MAEMASFELMKEEEENNMCEVKEALILLDGK